MEKKCQNKKKNRKPITKTDFSLQNCSKHFGSAAADKSSCLGMSNWSGDTVFQEDWDAHLSEN